MIYGLSHFLSLVSFSPPEAMEGGSVNVACSITPATDTFELTWKLNGVDYKGQFNSQWTNRPIRIPRVSQTDMGNWTCLVRFRGDTTEVTRFLQVKGAIAVMRLNAL